MPQTGQETNLATLRCFRDRVLKKHRSGILFVKAYYDFSTLTVPRARGNRPLEFFIRGITPVLSKATSIFL